MRKISILHLAKKYERNRPLRNIMILGTDPERYKVKVCYLSGKPDGKNILDRHGLSIYLDIDNPSKHKIRTTMMLKNCLKTERPDILHCHRHAASVFGILSSLTDKTKIIAHVHGLDRTRSFKRRFTNWLLLKHVDKIITVSNSVRLDVINTNWSLDPAKVVAVKNSIDLEIIDNVKISKMDSRLKLGISEDEVVFGTVGRLVPTKGQSYLLDAFSEVQRKIPNSRLVIMGDGPLFKKLNKRAEELSISSRVLFTGFREDVLELIRGLDVFVLPSLAEGLSIALLEAMASKLPVIASDVGGIPEVFGGSHCGRLIPPRDISVLSSAMVEIGSLNYEQRTFLGDTGRKRIEKEFTSHIMIKNLCDIYESVLAGAEKL
jgi:glycosyltransferase involved in cell wall biosynthesis